MAGCQRTLEEQSVSVEQTFLPTRYQRGIPAGLVQASWRPLLPGHQQSLPIRSDIRQRVLSRLLRSRPLPSHRQDRLLLRMLGMGGQRPPIKHPWRCLLLVANILTRGQTLEHLHPHNVDLLVVTFRQNRSSLAHQRHHIRYNLNTIIYHGLF